MKANIIIIIKTLIEKVKIGKVNKKLKYTCNPKNFVIYYTCRKI